MRILASIMICGFLLLPDALSAQDGLVPCTGVECNTCHAVELINNVVEFLIVILSVLAVIVMVVAGFRMVTSAGNQTAWESGKSMFTNVVIGIVIVLAAWLIVDTALEVLTGKGLKLWTAELCVFSSSASSQTAQQQQNGQSLVGNNTTGNLTTYAGAQFDSGVVDNVQYIDENFDLRVSGGHRTTERNAEVNGSPTSHHLTGRAADFVGSPSAMQAGADWARANGAREVIVHDAGSGNHLHVAW